MDGARGAGGIGRLPDPVPDAERSRYTALLVSVLTRAVAALQPKDRLRLASYYVQQLTLAETGRLLKESEATVSRQLARTRRAIGRTSSGRCTRMPGSARPRSPNAWPRWPPIPVRWT